MKFLCIECDKQMDFEERQVPGDGTFAAAFRCPACGRRIAMLANPMETQLVGSLGVRIGGRTLDDQPMELIRSTVVGRDDAFIEGMPPPTPGASPGTPGAQSASPGTPGAESASPGNSGARPTWSPEADERLARVPGFVRGMVKKIYGEYAAERGIKVITPDIMDRARTELGLEGM